MSHELTTISNAMDMWEDETKLQEIKKIFAPKLNTLEFQAFIGLGKATGLNPFLREIWAVKYAENSPAQIFIGRDGYRKSAQRNPNYDYHQSDAVYSNDTFEVVNGEIRHSYKLTNRGELIGGYCKVQRRSSSKPMYVYVNLKDYNKKQSCWNSIQATMIAKVAEAQCIRMAFQEQFAGSHSEFEEPIVIDGIWEPKTKATHHDKLNELLAKKGLGNANSIENHNNSTNSSNFISDSEQNNANNTDQTHSGERIIRTNMDADGTQENRSSSKENAIVPCTKAQLDDIIFKMDLAGFDDGRKVKALKHFGVDTFEQLTFDQANEMIAFINKA